MNKKSNKAKDIMLANSFSRVFADEFVLYSKMRIARWNVEGSDFYVKYNLFKTLYLQSEKAMSKVACQLVEIGESLPETTSELLGLSALKDNENEKRDSSIYVNCMLIDIRSIMNSLEKMKGDLGFSLYDWDTGSFIDDLYDMHQEMISMLTED